MKKNFVRHEPKTFEQLGSTICKCESIDEAARRAFRNTRYTDNVLFVRQTGTRDVYAFIRIQTDDGTMKIVELDSFHLEKKKGGKVPTDTIPELFLHSPRTIFKTLSSRVLEYRQQKPLGSAEKYIGEKRSTRSSTRTRSYRNYLLE